jgi:hypothetical protein
MVNLCYDVTMKTKLLDVSEVPVLGEGQYYYCDYEYDVVTASGHKCLRVGVCDGSRAVFGGDKAAFGPQTLAKVCEFRGVSKVLFDPTVLKGHQATKWWSSQRAADLAQF